MIELDNGLIVVEVPTGAVDGVNRDFETTYVYDPNAIAFFEDGVLHVPDKTGAKTIRTDTAPLTGSRVQVKYAKA